MKAGIDYIGIGVGALVLRPFNEGHEILLLRRIISSNNGGLWTIPGGAMEFGEFPDASIARELKEEAQLVILKASQIDLIVFIEQKQHWISIVFRVTKHEGVPKIGEPQQFDAIEWFSTDDLPPLDSITSRTLSRNLPITRS